MKSGDLNQEHPQEAIPNSYQQWTSGQVASLILLLAVCSILVWNTIHPKDLYFDEFEFEALAGDIHDPARNASVTGETLQILKTYYPKGIGVHANSELFLRFVPEGYNFFAAEIGVDANVDSNNNASVIFRVLTGGSEGKMSSDGILLYESPVLRPGMNPRLVYVPVKGRQSLTLSVTDANDGNESDLAIWALARFYDGIISFKFSTRIMYPIFLTHGFIGFRTFLFWEQYSGVVEALKKEGITAYRTIVHPSETIAVRAQQLLDIIHESIGPSEKFHLICHSMGGLDARFLVSPNGLNQGDRVVSLTTMATPHRGSPIAEQIPVPLRTVFSNAAGVAKHILRTKDNKQFVEGISEHRWAGMDQLKPSYLLEQFNPFIVDAPDVHYFSYAGTTNNQHSSLKTYLRQQCVNRFFDGVENDGLVSVESARWGNFKGILPADHTELVGIQVIPWMKNQFDHVAFYVALAHELMSLENN